MHFTLAEPQLDYLSINYRNAVDPVIASLGTAKIPLKLF